MQKTIWIRTALLIALASPALAQSGEPSLADIAHKDRDQQKHVITNDDFPSASTSDSSGSPSKPEDTTPSTATDSKKDTGNTGASKDNKKPEDVAELKKKLESYKQQQDMWTHSADQYQEKLSRETDEFRRDVYQRAMANDLHNAELMKKKISQVESQIASAPPSSSSNSGAVKPSSDHDTPDASHP